MIFAFATLTHDFVADEADDYWFKFKNVFNSYQSDLCSLRTRFFIRNASLARSYNDNFERQLEQMVAG